MSTTTVNVGYPSQPPLAMITNRAASLDQIERWQSNALKSIAALGRLGNNWDGYGSPPPSEWARNWAAEVVLRTRLGNLAPPEFGPESGGVLQMDWWSGHIREIELHIEGRQRVVFVKVEGGQLGEEGWFHPSDGEALERLVTWLRRG
jgi:hypothetical protein